MWHRTAWAFVVPFAFFLFEGKASAQFDDPAEKAVVPPAKTTKSTKAKPAENAAIVAERGVQLGSSETQIWQCGVNIRALGGPCAGLFGTIAVPTDWYEQQVKIGKEDVTPQVRKVAHRNLDGGVQQMTFSIPQLAANETAKAIVYFEVTRHELKPPPDPSIFVIAKNPPTSVRKYLANSPGIEAGQAKFKTTAQEFIGEKQTAWEQIEAIYDGVRAKVKWGNDRQKGAMAALNEGHAENEDITGVFIACCRAMRIPARTVYIPDSCYAEFYVEDAEANGYWIPAYLAQEKKEFGFTTTKLPILQKGDAFKVPEKKEVQRFVAEFLTGKGNTGGRPEVEFIRRVEPK